MSGAPLAGRVVAVTGSSSGIGAATARAFAAGGRRRPGQLGALGRRGSSRRRLAARRASTCRATSRSPRSPSAWWRPRCERWGRLDTLVNNAGTTAVIPHHDVQAASVDVWRRIFEVNVFGTWAMTVAALPALRDAQGARWSTFPRWPACGRPARPSPTRRARRRSTT